MLIDTHCHLTDERLAGETESIVSSFAADSLESVVTVGYDAPSSREGAQLAACYRDVYCTVGIHPHDAVTATQDVYDEFVSLANDNRKVVAIGEIGLDYYYDLSPRETQKRVFAEQLELAYALKLPVCLHVRDAYEDCRQILADNASKLVHGVLLHCYSGSAEMVPVFGKFDAYFAFGGAITFKNARRNLEALLAVPKDRLLVETDCPYMTPVPYRGRTNYPKYVNLVADKVAEALAMPRDEVDKITTENAKRLFNRLK